MIRWFKRKKKEDQGAAPEDIREKETGAKEEQPEDETPAEQVPAAVEGPEPEPEEELEPDTEQSGWDAEEDTLEEDEDETLENGVPKTGFFRRLRQRLKGTREKFVHRIDRLVLGKRVIDEDLLDELEEILITSDLGVRSNLVRLYGSSTDPANCTLVPGPNGPGINPRCRIVLDHICAAAPDVLTTLVDTGRRQEAMQKKQAFIGEYQCAPGPLNEVLP